MLRIAHTLQSDVDLNKLMVAELNYHIVHIHVGSRGKKAVLISLLKGYNSIVDTVNGLYLPLLGASVFQKSHQ